MITDQETNALYLADMFPARHPGFYAGLFQVLKFDVVYLLGSNLKKYILANLLIAVLGIFGEKFLY